MSIGKSELIQQLQEINGDPEVFVLDTQGNAHPIEFITSLPDDEVEIYNKDEIDLRDGDILMVSDT